MACSVRALKNHQSDNQSTNHRSLDNRVVFVTGGAGTICSMQTRALVRLGANACIIGRNVEKTEAAAKDIAQVRPGAKVIGIGGCDVRKVRLTRLSGSVYIWQTASVLYCTLLTLISFDSPKA